MALKICLLKIWQFIVQHLRSICNYTSYANFGIFIETMVTTQETIIFMSIRKQLYIAYCNSLIISINNVFNFSTYCYSALIKC